MTIRENEIYTPKSGETLMESQKQILQKVGRSHFKWISISVCRCSFKKKNEFKEDIL